MSDETSQQARRVGNGMGPQMKRLVAEFMAVKAIPTGAVDPFGAGLAVLTDRDRLASCAREAEAEARTAVTALLAAPDTTATCEEAAAEQILTAVAKRRQGVRRGVLR